MLITICVLSTTTNIEQRIQWRFGDDATADTFLNAGKFPPYKY